MRTPESRFKRKPLRGPQKPSSDAAPLRKVTARETALRVMRDVFEPPFYGTRAAIEYRATRAELDGRSRAFATELAYGTIKMRRLLDWWLAPYLLERANTIPKTIREILRMGAYQIRAMSGVETYAAVSESVGLAKRFGHRGTAGIVNAVLRRMSEVEAPMPARADFESDDDYLGTLHSYPTWLVTQLRARFGDERLEAILVGGNAPAPVGLRIDVRATSAEAVVAELAAAEIPAHASPFARDAVVLDGTAPTTRLDALLGSRAALQGEAALFPVDLLDPQPGETILELCSGRGNKTRQIVARTGDTGSVEAVELDARKAADLAAHLRAEGVASAVVFQRDAAFIDDEAEPADRALVDAPCSGIGIVGRQPEARWRKSPDDAARLAPQQLAILEAAAMRLRAGGTLVYSVCSTDAREGDDVIAAFLAIQPSFERVPLPERYAPFATPLGDVLVPPGIDGRDGFFVARLRRA